ncbi:hypothetical protein [Paenibacillus sp. FSL R5-0519]|uniref:hypothetical protein n=1 Tax=Paenibacillus sp. FSL R5-0519 TaxID=2921648 RepID=UPI0030DADD6F
MTDSQPFRLQATMTALLPVLTMEEVISSDQRKWTLVLVIQKLTNRQAIPNT